jgi:LysM repeat protein
LTETSVPELQQLNPALLRNTAPADFDVRVPKGTAAKVSASLELIPREALVSARLHTVEPGETLALISKRFNATPKTIAAANDLAAAEPAVGDRLVIPGAYKEAVVAKAAAKRKTVASSRTALARNSASKKVPAKASTQAASTRSNVKAPVKRAAPKTAGTMARR